VNNINVKLLSCLFLKSVSNQAIVTQEHQFLSIKEGDSISLKCSYSETASNLQRYQQYPGGQPEFMMILYTSKTVQKDNFEMSLDTFKKTTHLCMKNTQLKDSATYFCAWNLVLQRHLLVFTKGGGQITRRN
uniref:Immunoglobulin V-set domain-containing protein n=1 Tax=Naja naja TaxID=35670 RepID=A0A8C6VNT4_NAJNA